MTDLYLIAHKVRGEPAFDVARRFCEGNNGPCQPECGCWNGSECSMKDEWIIPTSGHSAFPYGFLELSSLAVDAIGTSLLHTTPEMPSNWRDHYEVTRDSPQAGKPKGKIVEIDLAELGL